MLKCTKRETIVEQKLKLISGTNRGFFQVLESAIYVPVPQSN